MLIDTVTTEAGTMEVWETMPHRNHLGGVLRKAGDIVTLDECNYVVEDVTPSGARCKAGKPVRIVGEDEEGNETVTIKRGKGSIMVSAYAYQ